METIFTKQKNTMTQNGLLSQDVERQLETIRRESLEDARILASKPTGNFQLMINVIDSKINDLLAYFIEKLGAKSMDIELEARKVNLNKLRKITEDRKESLLKQIQNLQLDLNKMLPLGYAWKYLKYWYLAILVLCLNDLMMNSRSLQTITSSRIGAFLLALTFVGSLMAASHFAGQWIREAKTKGMKWILFIATTVGVSSFFYMLATMRSTFLESMKESNFISPMIFVFLNLTFFAISLFIGVFFLPRRLDYKEKAVHDTIKKQLDDLISENEHLDKNLGLAETEFSKFVIGLGNLNVYRSDMASRIDRKRELICAECEYEFSLRNGAHRQSQIN